MVKRRRNSIKIGVHLPFGPRSPVELEALFRKKFGLAYSILSYFVHVLSHEVLRSEELFQVVQNLISYKKWKKQPSGHTCVLLSYVGQMMLTWSYSMRLDLVRPLLTSMTLSVLSILNLQKMEKM